MSSGQVGSLRSFHLVFILVAIMGADLFAGFTIHEYLRSRDTMDLILGIVSAVGGLGLALYAMLFVRKMDQAHIE